MSQTVQTHPKRTPVAELDIYSGRPNPSWTLSEEEFKRLAALVERLPRSSEAAPPSALGYRGITIAVQGAQPGEISRFAVSGGIVSIRRQGGEDETLSDAGRSIERWLLTTARGDARDMARSLLGDSFVRPEPEP